MLNDTSHKSVLTMGIADNEEAVHDPSHWGGGNEHGQLQFQITTLNQQPEKFQVAHHRGAVAPAGLVPLPQEDASFAISCGSKPQPASRLVSLTVMSEDVDRSACACVCICGFMGRSFLFRCACPSLSLQQV